MTAALGAAILATPVIAGAGTTTLEVASPSSQQLAMPEGSQVQALNPAGAPARCSDGVSKGRKIRTCLQVHALSPAENKARHGRKASRHLSMTKASYSATAAAAPTSDDPCDYADYYETGSGATYVLNRWAA